MENPDTVVEIEERLLPPSQDNDEEEDAVIFTASFSEAAEEYEEYETAKWVLYSVPLILAWGFGLLMLLYLPLRRFILRKDLLSRKLYLTPHAIVYKVTKLVTFPCFGVLKEKYVLLPSVADIVVHQGYLQSFFDVYSVRIENGGIKRLPSDDVQIQGIVNPIAFREAVLAHLANMRAESLTSQASVIEDAPVQAAHPQPSGMSPPNFSSHDALPRSELILLQKLEEVSSSIKRVQTLIEEQQS